MSDGTEWPYRCDRCGGKILLTDWGKPMTAEFPVRPFVLMVDRTVKDFCSEACRDAWQEERRAGRS